jgi:hypothetical protein
MIKQTEKVEETKKRRVLRNFPHYSKTDTLIKVTVFY